MGIRTRPVLAHWNYLLALEQDLERLSRFVEFDAKNFNCFSIEIARILLAAGAEVDVVCKQLSVCLNPSSKASTIGAYRAEIMAAFPCIPNFVMLMPRFGLELKPWDEWRKTEGVPFWWTAYNKAKHHRDSEYERANLKNALNAVAGLFIPVLYLYKPQAEGGTLLPSPSLFRVSEDHFGGTTVDYETGINYVL